MKEKYKALLDKIKAFRAKESLTDEEKTEFKAAVEEAKTLKAQINDQDALDKSADDLLKSDNPPVPGMPVIVKTNDNPAPTASQSNDYDVFGQRKDGTFGLLHTSDPLFGSGVIKEAASPEYRGAFLSYIRANGKRERLSREENKSIDEIMTKAHQVGVDDDGGLLVPPQMMSEVIRQRAGTTSLAGAVRRQPITSSALQIVRAEDSGSDVYTSSGIRIKWTGEGNAPDQLQNVKFKPLRIDAHEGEVEIPLTRTFMEDAPEAIELFVGQEFRSAFDLGVEDVVAGGDGVAKPFGIITRAGQTYGADILNVGDPVTVEGLIRGFYALPAQYSANASIYMRRDAFGELSTLEDTAGRLIFGTNTANDGLSMRAVESFKGTPVKFTDMLPALAPNSKFAIYGDLYQHYMLVMRMGATMRLRDIAGQQPAVVFRFRFGGDTLLGRAAKIWQVTDPS